MRPRSGKEYEKIDRSAIVSGLEHRENYKPALQLTSTSASLSNQNYVNISLNSEYSKSSCADYHISSFQEEYVMIKVRIPKYFNKTFLIISIFFSGLTRKMQTKING